jgi:YidC/Oxa1 family membrane protein insertase
MDKSYENRMLLVFAIAMVFLLTFLWAPKKTTQPAAPAANPVPAAQAAPVQASGTMLSNEAAYYLKKEVAIPRGIISTTNEISVSNELYISIDSYGARLNKLEINGKWNRKTEPVSLLSKELTYKTGDVFLGTLENLGFFQDRPVFTVKEKSPSNITYSAVISYKGNPIGITKKFTLSTNYQFFEEITIKNLTGMPQKIEIDGKSFSIGASYSFFPKELANSGNMLQSGYYDGNKVHKTLTRGFFDSISGMFGSSKWEPRASVPNAQWLELNDNYFITIMKPEFADATGRFIIVKEEKLHNEIALGLELPPLFLEGGEAKTFKISYYAGPKKESIMTAIDKSYSKLYSWPAAFNWLMKPIEWGITSIMFVLSKFIPNWGIIIILLALLIKLILSPLSIKAAVSIKRSNLLQPKLKNLQEKYKDDQKTLNEKIAELYKKEGVNPLGGCLPLLLQFPVFFALYKVLSTSVELKGAAFLWIKDMTQPDTLFSMSVPMLPAHFNLLPIIMTGVQILQMRLSAMKNVGATTQQSAINTYLLPVIFLFLFWGMPSGLVLYWTVQNIYMIVEQEVINLDKQVKLI